MACLKDRPNIANLRVHMPAVVSRRDEQFSQCSQTTRTKLACGQVFPILVFKYRAEILKVATMRGIIRNLTSQYSRNSAGNTPNGDGHVGKGVQLLGQVLFCRWRCYSASKA